MLFLQIGKPSSLSSDHHRFCKSHRQYTKLFFYDHRKIRQQIKHLNIITYITFDNNLIDLTGK